jgi:hypothetical protein
VRVTTHQIPGFLFDLMGVEVVAEFVQAGDLLRPGEIEFSGGIVGRFGIQP